VGQVIAVVSGKGGTGKTSLTALMGVALAKLGRRVLLLDCDVGLRDLDIAVGMSDSVLLDFTDVLARRASLEDAVTPHPRLEGLYLLTAPAVSEGTLPDMSGMKRLLDEARWAFDFCLLDGAAGLGDSFRLATRYADRVLVVTMTEPACLRDAQRTVMELNYVPTGQMHLIVNRVRRSLLKSLRANIDDAMDAAGLPLIGIVPEDDDLPAMLGKGMADSFSYYSPARRAVQNIARRLCGERVPLMRV